jgi:hypothetical protein
VPAGERQQQHALAVARVGLGAQPGGGLSGLAGGLLQQADVAGVVGALQKLHPDREHSRTRALGLLDLGLGLGLVRCSLRLFSIVCLIGLFSILCCVGL